MKALILGGGGQVGRALAATAPAGAEVVSLTRAECDIGNADQLRKAITDAGADILFNAAAYTGVDKAESEPAAAHRLNAEAPGTTAEAARSAGTRLVHISTDFVFDGTASTPRKPEHATGPTGVYAATKLAGEQAVAAADPGALIVRTAWVYAPQGANFVNTMLRLMREREMLKVVSDQIGSPTYAPSLAQALWDLARANATGILHYTDAGVASWYDFAVAIQEEGCAAGLLQRPTEVVPIMTADYPTPAKRPSFSVLDKSTTWALLGRTAPHWRVNLRANLEALAHG